MEIKLNNLLAKYYLVLLCLVFLCISSCGDDSNNAVSDKIQIYPVTYSFFDVDVNSVLSHNLKSRLDNILGDHSIETRGTINLNINSEGFLNDYLPYFEELNQKLNSPTGKPVSSTTREGKISLIGERVEHNTVKLVYRYAVKKALPFTYVEFLFSELNSTPLLIKVKFKKDDLNIVETLQQKYGTPRDIPWKEENGKSLCWEKSGDLLILSFVPDQFGKPVYEVVIYFAKRLEDLLQAELLEKETRQKKVVKSGQNVF